VLRKLFSVGSAFVSLTSLLFVFAAINDLITGDTETSTGILLGLLVFFAAVTAGSGMASVRLWRKPALDLDALEPRLLQLAAANEGRLSVLDVSMALSLPLKDAQRCLDHLAASGVAEHFVTDDGAVLYGLRRASLLERREAERV